MPKRKVRRLEAMRRNMEHLDNDQLLKLHAFVLALYLKHQTIGQVYPTMVELHEWVWRLLHGRRWIVHHIVRLHHILGLTRLASRIGIPFR